MAQKNLNQILALALDAANQLKMEKRACMTAGRESYRLEYIEEQITAIVDECEKGIESNEKK